MKTIRLGVLALAASLAIGAMAVTVASASPEIKPAEGEFVGAGLASTLKTVGDTVSCETDENDSYIGSSHLLGPLTIHFSGCKSSEGGGAKCAVNSTGEGSGEITTTTVHAVIGLVLPSNLVGLLYLPTSGKRFETLEANACTPEAAVTGSFAGLVTPVGTLSLSTSVNFGSKAISLIDVLGGRVEPQLVAFSETGNLEAKESIEWCSDHEVTG
jgi:hypothetical protein